MALKESLKIFIRKLTVKSPWSGRYPNWQQALQQSTGYDAADILKKVESATLKVKYGEAVYERDSVLFDQIEYSWPLLTALLFVANKYNNSLKVLDFGGSLGSSYFQNRKFLAQIRQVEWNVVEQPSFVATGREKIADEQLRFFNSVEEYISQHGVPHLLVLSCTLPYLEKPYEMLDKLLSYKIPYLVIDNTYFNYEDHNRICLQQVPAEIYQASYPCWFLHYEEVKRQVGSKYEIISEHANDGTLYLDGRKVRSKGLLAGLKK